MSEKDVFLDQIVKLQLMLDKIYYAPNLNERITNYLNFYGELKSLHKFLKCLDCEKKE